MPHAPVIQTKANTHVTPNQDIAVIVLCALLVHAVVKLMISLYRL
jgi:hypothetical protein